MFDGTAAKQFGGHRMYEGNPAGHAIPLTVTEKAFVDAVCAAEPTAFDAKADGDGKIRSEVIRALVMGRSLSFEGSHFTVRALPPSGIRLRNGEISGPLDLTGARASDGGPAVPLELESCVFDAEVVLKRGHFRHISFKGSILACIDAEHVYVEAPVNLSNIAGKHKRGCYFFLQGLRCSGPLSLDHSQIANLNLRDARIAGRLCLNGSKAEFTTISEPLAPPYASHALKNWSLINICSVVIGGDLEMKQASIRVNGNFQHEYPAIMAEHATVEGDVFMDNLAVFTDTPEVSKTPNKAGPTLNFEGFAVRGFLRMADCNIDGSVKAAGLVVGGNFQILDSQITKYVFLVNVSIAGNLRLQRSDIAGSVNCYLSEIGGDATFGPASSVGHLDLNNGNVNGDLAISDITADQVSLRGARIRNTLSVSDCTVSKTVGSGDDVYRSSPETKTINFLDGSYFNVGKQFAFDLDSKYYYDQKKSLYADLSYFHSAVRGSIAFRISAGDVPAFGYITFSRARNDYVFHRLRAPSDAVKAWMRHFVQSESQAKDIVTFCEEKNMALSSRQPGETNQEQAEAPYTRRLESLPDDQIAATFGQYMLARMRKVLHFDTVKPLTSWKTVREAEDATEPDWNLYGVETHELDDDNARGYGHGLIELDEFKYDYITRSDRLAVPIGLLGGSYFKTLSITVSIIKSVQAIMNTWASVQAVLRKTKVDLTVTIMYLGLLAAILSLLILTPMAPVWAKLPIQFFYANAPVLLLFTAGLGTLGWLIGFDLTNSPSGTRKRWLKRQFSPPHLSQKQGFRPFPYEFLARYFRARGYDHDSRRILSQRLTEERRLKTIFFLRPLSILFQLGFDYGLSPGRAVTTFAFCMAVGFIGCLQLQRGYVIDPGLVPIASVDRTLSSCSASHPPVACMSALVVSTNTVNTAALVYDDKLNAPDGASLVRPAMPIMGPGFTASRVGDIEIPCGNTIQASLYAIDTFIPAIDLGQESQCQVSEESKYLAWRWAKAIYSLMGWLITSLVILTVSGILRRQVEG